MIEQVFTPALTIMRNGNLQQIQRRTWAIAEESSNYTAQATLFASEDMGLLGVQQIEEVWKFYEAVNKTKSGIYVSNLGYVMEMDDKRAQEVFGDTFRDDFEKGVVFRKLNKEQKQCIKECNFVPANNESSGFQIDLYVKQLGTGCKVYRMVAEKFLSRPEGESEVHHIDNNSYNNSVTNLIWLSKDEHNLKTHPMSYWR